MFDTIKHWFKDIKYWVMYHTFWRYHILDISSPKNDYKYGWMDVSEAIMYASFKLLKDCVEKEKILECHIDWDYDDKTRSDKKEIQELYDWWVKGRREEHDKAHSIFATVLEESPKDEFVPCENGYFKWLNHASEHPLYNEWLDCYNKLPLRDDEMLMRLINIRKVLWT